MSLSLMNAAKFRQVVLMGKDKADAGIPHYLLINVQTNIIINIFL